MEFKKRNISNQSRPKSAPSLPVRPSTLANTSAANHTSSSPSKLSVLSRISRLFFTKKAVAIIIMIIVLFTGYYVIQSNTHASDLNHDKKAVLDPGYQTILPSGKSINELGGWKRISPPESDPVYAYSDTIDSVPVSVSQQPLPKSFANNTKEHVAELAKKFNATTEVKAGDTIVYVGTSAKGPQSVIFIKNNVLILIKSQRKIETVSWQQYADSLNEYQY